jgi:ribokinase
MVDIVVLGSLNMDLVVQTERAPLAGETLAAQEFHVIPGGKGANQAAAIGRMGGSVAMVGCVGEDGFGHQLRENLVKQQVDVGSIVCQREVSTGTALIIVEADGQNRILIVAGANATLSPAVVDAALPLLRSARLLVMQFEIPQATIAYAMHVAEREGLAVLLNPSPVYAMAPELFRQVEYLIVNEVEASLLSGVPVGDVDEACQAAARLRGLGAHTVILTLGAQGAWVASDTVEAHVASFPITAVDTTAAGDAFIGGFAAARLQGKDLVAAVRFGNAAGALAATRLGAQTSIPTAGEVQAFMAKRSQ